MVKETSVRKRRCTSHAYTSTAGLSFLYTTRGSGKGWCKQSGCLCIRLILIACSRVKASHVCRGIGGTIVFIRITNETLFFRCDMKSTGVERARRTMKTGPLGRLARWPVGPLVMDGTLCFFLCIVRIIIFDRVCEPTGDTCRGAEAAHGATKDTDRRLARTRETSPEKSGLFSV